MITLTMPIDMAWGLVGLLSGNMLLGFVQTWLKLKIAKLEREQK